MKGKNFYDYTAYVYLTSKDHMKAVLENFQGKSNPAVDIESGDLRFPGMTTVTATEGFRKCFKCGASDHEARNCRDLCLRLVLFQEINWTYAKHIKEITGAYKITVGATNKGRIVNWGFAHFKTVEEREAATKGLQSMFKMGHVLEPILSYDRGPPPCCHFCGQVDSLAGEEGSGHRQKECPSRFRRPQVDATKRQFLQGGRPSTYAEALRGPRRPYESKSVNETGPVRHSQPEKKEEKDQDRKNESKEQQNGSVSPPQGIFVLANHSPRAASSPRVPHGNIPSPRLSRQSPRGTHPSPVLNATANPYQALSPPEDDKSETAPDADVEMISVTSEEKGAKPPPSKKKQSKKKQKNISAGTKARPTDNKATSKATSTDNKATSADNKATSADNKATPAVSNRKDNAKKRHSKIYIQKPNNQGARPRDLRANADPVRPLNLRLPPHQTQSITGENVQLGDPGPLTALQVLQTSSLSSLYVSERIEDDDSQLNDGSSKKRKTNTTDHAQV